MPAEPTTRSIRLLALTALCSLSACQPGSDTTQAKDVAAHKGAEPSASPADTEPVEADLLDQEVAEEEAPEEAPALDGATHRQAGKKDDGEANKRGAGADRKPGKRKKQGDPQGAAWDDANDDGRFRRGDFASLEAELSRLEGQMRLAGVPLPPVAAIGGSATGSTSSVAPGDQPLQCGKACELTEAICALSDNICEMGKRHPGEEQYTAACERSKKDCELGTKTCETCSK